MSEVNFDVLGREVMVAAFVDAWEVDNSEVDGSRTYAVDATRKLFEAAGVSWREVVDASTEGYELLTGQTVNEQR